MTDEEIMRRIGELVDEEHDLRDRAAHQMTDDERARLHALGTGLDQCWDLLRRRRAKKEFGENPDEEQPRPVSEVESYRQ